jgi:iron complex transport system substrate-binding protein
VLLPCAAEAAQPIAITDDRGKTVVLARSAQRIVTAAPHLTELVFAAGAGARVAGVASFSDFPPQASKLPQIGDAARVDLERVVALGPDLILAWRSGNQAGDIERLEHLGFPVFVTEPARLTDIPRLLRLIGALAAAEPSAERAAAAFERDLEGMRTRFGMAARVRVFYEVWHRPLITVSGAHMISDVIALCGGENVFASAPILVPTVSLEAVIAARPGVILGGRRPGGTEEFAREWRASAVGPLREVPVFYVDPDLIQRQTPRIVEGARAVCNALEDVRRNRR